MLTTSFQVLLAFAGTGGGNNSVNVAFGDPIIEQGIHTWAGDSGSIIPATKGGRTGAQTNLSAGTRYIYCNVDDSFIYGGKNTVKVTMWKTAENRYGGF